MTGTGSNPGPRVPALTESETSSSSSFESISECEDHGNEDRSTVQPCRIPVRRPPGERDRLPRTQASGSQPSKRPQRQRKPPGWLTTGNWVK